MKQENFLGMNLLTMSQIYLGLQTEKLSGHILEHKFQDYLGSKYDYSQGSPAKGIDFPELGIDVKVTSIKQPQSSCPFKSAGQKIYGLGYDLIVFVYEKSDNETKKTGRS